LFLSDYLLVSFDLSQQLCEYLVSVQLFIDLAITKKLFSAIVILSIDVNYFHETVAEGDIVVHLIDKDSFLGLILLIVSLGLFREGHDFEIYNLHERIGGGAILFLIKFAHSGESVKLW
jgi:hypothetical protein